MSDATHVVLIDPEGKPGLVPIENADAARSEGFIDAPEDVTKAYVAQKSEDIKRESYNQPGVKGYLQGRVAEGLGGLRGLGASVFIPTDVVAAKTGRLLGGQEGEEKVKTFLSDYEKYRPVESAVGELGGMIAPAFIGDPVGVAKLGAAVASKAPQVVGESLGARLAQAAIKHGVQGAVEGAAIGAVGSANDQALRDGSVSVEKFLADTGMGLGIGALGGVVVGAGATALEAGLRSIPGVRARSTTKIADALEDRAAKRLFKELGPDQGLLKSIINEEGPEAVPLYAKEILAATKEAGVDIGKMSPDAAVKVSSALERNAVDSLLEIHAETRGTAEGLGIAPLKLESLEVLGAPERHTVSEFSKAVDDATKRLESIASKADDAALTAKVKAVRQRVIALDAWNDAAVTDMAKMAAGRRPGSFDSIFSLPSKAGFAAGSAVGGLPGGVAGAAIARTAANALETARPYAVSGLLSKASTWARLQSATEKMDTKVANGIASFLAGKAPAAVELAPVVFSQMDGRKRDQAVEKHSKALESMVTNADVMRQHVEKVTSRLPDATEAQPMVASRIAQNIRFLRDRLPKNRLPQVGPFAKFAEARYADAEVAAYERYLATVADPMEAVRAMQRGGLTKDHVDALRDTAPEVYESFQKALMDHAVREPGMQPMEQLYQLFGVPMAAHQDPAFVNMVQQAYLSDANKRQEGAQGGGSAKKYGSLSKTSQSQTDRLDEPK